KYYATKGKGLCRKVSFLYLSQKTSELMDQLTLGIGTRLQHTQYGPGVIIGVRYATYLISFITHGIKEIDKRDTHLDEIIPENVTEEIETHSDVEKSLLKILRLWSNPEEVVPLGDR